jgi:hypothetical protein
LWTRRDRHLSRPFFWNFFGAAFFCSVEDLDNPSCGSFVFRGSNLDDGEVFGAKTAILRKPRLGP